MKMRAFIVAVLSTAMLSFFRTVLVEAASPPNPSQNLAITATAPGTNIDGLKFICDPPYGGDAGYVYLGSEATIFSFRSLQTTSGFVTVFIAIVSSCAILILIVGGTEPCLADIRLVNPLRRSRLQWRDCRRTRWSLLFHFGHAGHHKRPQWH